MIYFIEGIMGVGKTTYAQSLLEQYKREEKKVELFYEHTVENKLDFTRKACIDEEQFLCIREKYYDIILNDCDSEYKSTLFENSIDMFEDKRLISYVQWDFSNRLLIPLVYELYDLEICNGNVTYEQYKLCIMQRWKAFFSNCTTIENQIYEGAFFQNILIDLIGFYQLSDSEVIRFYTELVEIMKQGDVTVVWIYTDDVYKVLMNANETRCGNRNHWMDCFEEWIQNSPYGKANHLKGAKGVCRFASEMQRIQKLILQQGYIKYKMIERKN